MDSHPSAHASGSSAPPQPHKHKSKSKKSKKDRAVPVMSTPTSTAPNAPTGNPSISVRQTSTVQESAPPMTESAKVEGKKSSKKDKGKRKEKDKDKEREIKPLPASFGGGLAAGSAIKSVPLPSGDVDMDTGPHVPAAKMQAEAGPSTSTSKDMISPDKGKKRKKRKIAAAAPATSASSSAAETVPGGSLQPDVTASLPVTATTGVAGSPPPPRPLFSSLHYSPPKMKDPILPAAGSSFSSSKSAPNQSVESQSRSRAPNHPQTHPIQATLLRKSQPQSGDGNGREGGEGSGNVNGSGPGPSKYFPEWKPDADPSDITCSLNVKQFLILAEYPLLRSMLDSKGLPPAHLIKNETLETLTKIQIRMSAKDKEITELQKKLRLQEHGEKGKIAKAVEVGLRDVNMEVRALNIGAKARDEVIEIQCNTIEDVKEAVTCTICYEYLAQPHTINPCGHTACAPCLFAWFSSPNSLVHPLRNEEEFRPFDEHAHGSRSRKCMTCQTALEGKPSVNYVALETVEKIEDGERRRQAGMILPMAIYPPVGLPGKDPKGLLDALKKVNLVGSRVEQLARNGPGSGNWADVWEVLFANAFGEDRRRWYMDEEDGVMRCDQCGYEIEGRNCYHCEIEFSDLEDEDDMMEEDEEDEDLMEGMHPIDWARMMRSRRAQQRDIDMGEGPPFYDDPDAGLEDDAYHQAQFGHGFVDPHGIPEPEYDSDEDSYEGSFINDEEGEEVLPQDEDDDDDLDGSEAEDWRVNRAELVARAARERRRAMRPWNAPDSEEEEDEVRIIGAGEARVERGVARRGNAGPESDEDDVPRARRNRIARGTGVIDLESSDEEPPHAMANFAARERHNNAALPIFSDEEEEMEQMRGVRQNSMQIRRRIASERDTDDEEEEEDDEDGDEEEETERRPRPMQLIRRRVLASSDLENDPSDEDFHGNDEEDPAW